MKKGDDTHDVVHEWRSESEKTVVLRPPLGSILWLVLVPLKNWVNEGYTDYTREMEDNLVTCSKSHNRKAEKEGEEEERHGTQGLNFNTHGKAHRTAWVTGMADLSRATRPISQVPSKTLGSASSPNS